MAVVLQFVSGWPGALLGIALLLTGVAINKVWLNLLGALLVAGLCIHMSLGPLVPSFKWLALVAMASSCLSIYAVKDKNPTLAAVLLLPVIGLFGWLVNIAIQLHYQIN